MPVDYEAALKIWGARKLEYQYDPTVDLADVTVDIEVEEGEEKIEYGSDFGTGPSAFIVVSDVLHDVRIDAEGFNLAVFIAEVAAIAAE